MPVGPAILRACGAACSKGTVPTPTPPLWLAGRGSYRGSPAAAVYLSLFRTWSWPLPFLRPPPPLLFLPVPVRLLSLLAMAWRAAMVLMEWPSGLTRLCLSVVAVLAAALVTSPVVGLSSSMRPAVGWPPCVVASPLAVVVCSLLCLLAPGAWLPATSLVPPLPPVAAETPALALSPVGVWVPIRLWGSSPPAAGVISNFKRKFMEICVPRARRVASLPLWLMKTLTLRPLRVWMAPGWLRAALTARLQVSE